jgi:hypothetical protein
MAINRWWDGDPTEMFWLETTDRAVLGVDLAAPQTDDAGREHPAYALISEVCGGDVVFHYHTERRAIVAWSRATGSLWQEDIVWASHGTVAREAGVQPYQRPGWRHGLQGPFWLEPAVTLDELRAVEPDVRAAHDLVQELADGALYFPFALSEKRPLRPTQFYLTKFPSTLLEALPSLASVVAEAAVIPDAETALLVAEPPAFGQPYVPGDEHVASVQRDPFEVDPSVVDRSLRAHAGTQNALAEMVAAAGGEPLSPLPTDPKFDLAWVNADGKVSVAEIKSITSGNEEQQLRLGLGQVLRYRQLLASRFADVMAVLAVERKPSDVTWCVLCDSLGVRLVWPDTMRSAVHR